jgi:hypothetical protein
MGDPFADSSFSAGDHGTETGSASASASGDSGTTQAGTTGDGPLDPTTASTSGASESDGSEGTTSAAETGPAIETGTDDGESSTTEPAIACIDLGECQPCVDCTVQPGGECQDEALACQGDGDCNALAACYNGCAMMFMGDELEACIATCYDDHPDAVLAFEAAYGCFVDECGELCPTEFGPL